MATEADRVVVELVAQTQGFDAQIKQSGKNFTSTMGEVEKASKGVEKAVGDVSTAHAKLGLASNNARIAQMELQHVVRGSVDQFAAGAAPTQIFAQHIAMVAEAASFMGGSLGAVGTFLAGPWGIAVTAGVAILATFIARHHDAADSVEGLVEKLKKHHDATQMSEEADRIWGRTIDALIDKQKGLNEQLDKRLTIQPVVDQQALGAAQNNLNLLGKQLFAAEADPKTTIENLKKLQTAFSQAAGEVYKLSLIVGEQEGAAMASLDARAQEWSDKQKIIIRSLIGYHPELEASSGALNAAFAELNKGVSDAAKNGVAFDGVTRQVDVLNNKLLQSPDFIQGYIAELKKLAAQLEQMAGADGALKKFEAAVIGAEGTGPNRMGSSAAGIGQFMPGTWLQYFNRLFPQFANMTDAGKLDERNNPTAAKAVIEAAANDYAAALKRAGIAITETSLYAMHLLGNRDALKLLSAPPGQSTSAFLSPRVLSGNPFLQGTASDALGAIGKRIGDSSGAVGAAAVQMANQQVEIQQRLSASVAEYLGKEVEVEVVKESQAELSREITGHVTTMAELLASGILPSLKAWEKEYDTIIHSQEELNRFGGELIDTVLNPDNWSSWGDMGKRILHELEMEFITLAAINPLKNLLTGGTLPTLGGVFSKLGGLFGGGGSSGVNFSVGADTLGGFGTVSAPHLAGGGSFQVGGAVGDVHSLSVDGVRRAMVSGNETVAVIPSNAKAASPGAGQSVQIILGVEASEYFDARVLRTTGPVIAQSSVAAANGGASIGRRNLERESRHRL